MNAPALPAASPARRVLSATVKTALVGVLLYYLAQKGFLSWEEISGAYGDGLGWAVGGHVLLTSATILSIWRWQIVLRAQDIVLPFRRTLALGFIGNFFNVALPGAVTGDLVKAYYIGQDVEGRRARAFGAIFFDRVLGLASLIIVVAGAQVVGATLTGPPAVLEALRAFTVVLAVGTVGFFTYLFLVPEERDLVLRVFAALERRVHQVAALREFYLGMRAYHHRPWAVLRAMVVSCGIHLVVGLASTSFAWAMGERQLMPLQVYASVPLAFLVTMIPVAPGGLGTGHAAFLFLVRLAGSERGADVFTLFALNGFLVGAVGGLVYLRFRGGAGRAPAAMEPTTTTTPS
ncbi:MAG: flippase-like domain-containing protein [Deltaproteobacteria bacterium]|nr:flippase-like domain-containing protein [Deltaproteobacteria bacterium]